jgi:aspartate kinase
MIVMKFGGSSLESAEAIRRVAGIVRDRVDQKPVVVVSAMGKTTNALLAMAKAAVEGDQDYRGQLIDLQNFHIEHARSLSPTNDHLIAKVEELFDELAQLLRGLEILGEITPRSTDAIASYGERLSSLIVAAAFVESGFPACHMDSRDVLVTDSRHMQAAPDFELTGNRLRTEVIPKIQDQVVVMGGFIGANAKGVTTTLGRGGSDYSAAIFGAGIDADEIQIWTDVDGMMTTDPRVIKDARPISTISFSEAAELAYFGAKVLHPATVRPAVDKNIPVVILNSRRPEAEGTRIVGRSLLSEHVVKALAFKRHITMVNLHSDRMFMTHGFLRKVFEVFDRFETSIDMVTTSEVNVSLTLDDSHSLGRIRAELSEFADIHVEENLALVSAVGEGIGQTAGVAARIFKALENVNVRMISQGASLLNLSVLIAQEDLDEALRALHHELFEGAPV